MGEYIDWFNVRRLHGEIGMIPPIEKENAYYSTRTQPATAQLAKQGLQETRGDSDCLRWRQFTGAIITTSWVRSKRHFDENGYD